MWPDSSHTPTTPYRLHGAQGSSDCLRGATPARELTQVQGASKCLTALRYGAGDVDLLGRQSQREEVCGARNGVDEQTRRGVSSKLVKKRSGNAVGSGPRVWYVKEKV